MNTDEEDFLSFEFARQRPIRAYPCHPWLKFFRPRISRMDTDEEDFGFQMETRLIWRRACLKLRSRAVLRPVMLR